MAVAEKTLFQGSDKTNPQLLPIKALRSSVESRDYRIRALHTKLVGQSEIMRTLKQLIQIVARSEETVLITGESGTGKELIARAIHELSPRCDGPYLAVNCGALAESLLESELFGHVKGAFTGATSNKKGFFEAAKGGTIFLDEFAEMSLNTQQRLLRVLQERKVRPTGSTEPRETKIDVRVVVATNHDLKRDVSEGKFRSDLYYRVNVLEIDAPALRDRLDDLPLLVERFIRNYNERNGGLVSEEISADVLTILKSYMWPGNVRELENIIKRLTLKVGAEGVITQADVRSLRELTHVSASTNIHYAESTSQQTVSTGHLSVPAQGPGQCRCSQELDWYRCRIKEAGGSITDAARQLNIPRTTFRYRMRALKSRCTR
jgi:transcriptional regulator with PAS, ATPase and Fis domain